METLQKLKLAGLFLLAFTIQKNSQAQGGAVDNAYPPQQPPPQQYNNGGAVNNTYQQPPPQQYNNGGAVNNTYQPVYSQPAVVTPPMWAPPYDNPAGIQYYYIPDIECYYDVWNSEFVYMENGRWLFSPVLPAYYASYDLMHGHVVVLARMVHQPWMHHELSLQHYPRYYHHDVYPARDGYSRPYGYDENARRPLYAPERDGGRPAIEHHEREQTVHYRNENVGRPVHVEDNMRRPEHHDEHHDEREHH
jgi:hypothetical protein